MLLIIVNIFCPVLYQSYPGWWVSAIDLLTAELHSDEIFKAQVLQKDPRGSAGLEVEGDVRGELSLQGGEEEGGGLLIEGC